MKIETNLGGPAFGAIELDAGTGRVKNGSVLKARWGCKIVFRRS